MTLIQTTARTSFLTSKSALLGLTGLVALSFGGFALAQDAKVVAKAGAIEITAADLDQAMIDMRGDLQRIPEPQRRARALDTLIDIHILAQKAQKDGMDADPTMKRRLALLRARALHNGYFQKNVQPGVTEEQIKARYDKEVGSAVREQEVSARHILVKTEEEAKAIIAELAGGADFIELAKTKSTGPSGANGGDLGFFGKGRMVPAFEVAAFKLAKGEYTKEPVKTNFGYHIIKVDDKRDQPAPTLEASRKDLRQLLLTEAYGEAVKGGRAELGVEIMDPSLKLPETK